VKSHDLTVFIVDDDASVRDALGLLLSIRGYRSAPFADAEDFLQAWSPEWAGCLLLDIRMPGMDGLTLQRRLLDLGCRLPIVVITGHGDVGSAREAFKASAIDFLEKPLDHAKLFDAIDEAFRWESVNRDDKALAEEAMQLLASLTPREREVMSLVVAGCHNREVAQRLGISVRTVEVHKAHVMSKLGVDNFSDLVRISIATRPVKPSPIS
jgi:FixJ family two-component response regulator